MSKSSSLVKCNLRRLIAKDGRGPTEITLAAFGARWADAGRSQLQRALTSGSLGDELAGALTALWDIELAEFYREVDPAAVKEAEDARELLVRQQRIYGRASRVGTDALDAAISRLESDEARLAFIIRQRLDGLSQAAIGEELDITRQRVRQLESEAHQILRRDLGL